MCVLARLVLTVASSFVLRLLSLCFALYVLLVVVFGCQYPCNQLSGKTHL